MIENDEQVKMVIIKNIEMYNKNECVKKLLTMPSIGEKSADCMLELSDFIAECK